MVDTRGKLFLKQSTQLLTTLSQNILSSDWIGFSFGHQYYISNNLDFLCLTVDV